MHVSKTLNITAATLIARELGDFKTQKLMEIASFLLDKSNKNARKLITRLKMYPEILLEELYHEIMTN